MPDVPCAPVEGEEVEAEIEGEEFVCEPCEVEPLRFAPSPQRPSAADVEEHRVTHIPCRSWCRECVEGKALGEQRGHAKDACESMVAVVGVDYFFTTAKGVHHKKAEAMKELDVVDDEAFTAARLEGKVVKNIIVRCSSTKLLFAHQVPVKGVDEDKHVVKLVCEDLEWMGHAKIILKCDNEPAIKSVIAETLTMAKVEVADLQSISKEHPEKYESQSNGMVEVGIKNFRGHYRTLKRCLEQRLGVEIPVGHPLMAWMTKHVCFIMNATVRGDDGLTAWARARGRPFRQRLIGFVESCLYKLPIKGPQHDAEGNMGPRWKSAVFLGYNRDSSSYVLGTDEGVVTSRAVMRRPIEDRWSLDEAKSVKATPWDMLQRAELEVVLKPVTEKLEEFEDKESKGPRRFKITKRDLEAVGFTKDCQQCEHIIKEGAGRGGLQHGERCRKRVMEELSKTPAGKARVGRAEERISKL